MPAAADMIRGHTDAIILYHLMGKDSYGYEINKSIQEATGNTYEFKEATLYTAFRRLEQGGYIRSYWGDETTGARRRYYAITQEGRVFYAESMKQWRRAKAMLDMLTGNTNEEEQG